MLAKELIAHGLSSYTGGIYAYVRLDKKNQRQIRAALGGAGFDVETIIED